MGSKKPTMVGNKYGRNGGRPTKYDSKYCQMIIDFFNVDLVRRIIVKETIHKDGKKDVVYDYVPNRLPTLYKFCKKIKIHPSTLPEWIKNHKEFSEAYYEVKEAYKDFLCAAGLLGHFNPGFATFVAINTTTMKDKKDYGFDEDVNAAAKMFIAGAYEFHKRINGTPEQGDGKEAV